MEIQVVTSSKAKRELIESVASLFAQSLKLENSKYTLTIGTIAGLAKADKMNGMVCLIAPKCLFMTLDSRLSFHDLLITLAHEMIHVKQYAKGQLKLVVSSRGKFSFSWMGKKHIGEYYDCPWELEAFSRERILANKVAQIIQG